MAAIIRSRRPVLKPFEMADATDVFACITPEVTRHMRRDPPVSLTEFRTRREVRMRDEEHSTASFVIRRTDTEECLGILHMLRTGGRWRDVPAPAVLAAAPGRIRRLLADKGYDADWLRADLRKAGVVPVIPGTRSRKRPIRHDERRCKDRWRAEAVFCP